MLHILKCIRDLLLIIALCNSAEGLSCYKCNTTAEDPACLGGNPSIQQTCVDSDSDIPGFHGCYSMLINGRDIYKGCLTYYSAPASLVHWRDCIYDYTNLEVKPGKCVKGLVTKNVFKDLMQCRLSGTPQNGGGQKAVENVQTNGGIEVAICICQGTDLCNAHTDKMDPGGSQVEWSKKPEEPSTPAPATVNGAFTLDGRLVPMIFQTLLLAIVH